MNRQGSGKAKSKAQELFRLLRRFLRDRLRTVLLVLACIAICIGVFVLYGSPGEAAGYAALLCAVAVLLVGIADFSGYYKRHRAFESALKSIAVTCDTVPAPLTLSDSDYDALLNGLRRELNGLATRASERQTARDDYYTLWMHQIKTPIAAMRLILQQSDTGENRELEAQLFTIERYVDMALAFVRTDSETTDFVIRTQELDGIVRQSIRKYAPMFIRSRVKLCYTPSERKVVTDEKWLCFVIEQILSNAAKYTANGSVTVCCEGDDLIIRDTGVGISAEDLPRVGEKGFTGRNGRSDKRATGLGLYLCRRILSALGHTLKISSAPGSGTEVRIGLPDPEKYFE